MKSRLTISIHGIVQGVGFRPFIYNLANELNLKGCVFNNAQGVNIAAEGELENLKEFILRIESDKPKISSISGMEFSYLDYLGYKEFKIIESSAASDKTALISPDIALCKNCLEEMNDPSDRRFRYPFINCTNCGPRFSIIESLPYDRPNTSMKTFKMCDKCATEYNDPQNRRFHAQPIACHDCGPSILLTDPNGTEISRGNKALLIVRDRIKDGKIIALKGLGGFQLLADAKNNQAVNTLRARKNREEKPFALMFPSVESVAEVCIVNDFEKRLLESPESPIVLLKRKRESDKFISPSVAPDNPYLGVMLPYTPLHHLILKELNFSLIATSGNIAEEPICINDLEAFEKLGNIADFFLTHNRPIVRQVDDSIVRMILNQEIILRRARGYSPLPVSLSNESNENLIAVGAHLKNSVAFKIGKNVFISQHIGDLSSESAYEVFLKTITDFSNLYEIKPQNFITDKHPGYISTDFVRSTFQKYESVQHHFAHIASCKVENQINDRTLGVAWDGTGYGIDGTVWGGEFFISDQETYSHVGQLRQFKLPGGEKAIKESRRSAIGLLFEIYGIRLFEKFEFLEKFKFSKNELSVIQSMLVNNINSPVTSSAGRLFDAVASILGISHISNFEGQSAMKLEFVLDHTEKGRYGFGIREDEKIIIDWENMILSIIEESKSGIDISKISARFHNSLASIILRISEIYGEEKVVLSGGCFQNIYLTEKVKSLLERNKFKVYIHQRVPPNDGGISLGQIAARNIKYADFDFSTFTSKKEVQYY